MIIDEVAVPPPVQPKLLRSGAIVGVGSAVANVIAFALTIVLAQFVLGKADVGAVVALLGVAIVGQVPAIALQAVVARHVAVAPVAERAAVTRALLGHAVIVGLVIAGVVGALSVPMADLLHLSSPAPMLWLAVALWPTTVVFAVQGALQGAERFTGLTALLILVAATRVAGGVAGGFVGGVAGVLLGVAGGAVVALTVALGLERAVFSVDAAPVGARALYAELWPAVAGMGALLALTNTDVILARHFLSGPESGLYAGGAIAGKVAFWFPQAVAMVVFPRLADPSRSAGLLGKAAAVILGLGVVTSGVCASPLGPWAFGHLLGAEYVEVGPLFGLFAAAGSAGTLVQLALYSGIAARDRLMTGGLVLALAIMVTLIWTVAHSSMPQIIGTVFGTLALAAAAGLALSSHRTRARARA